MITAKRVEQALGMPFEQTKHRCHEISLALVRSGVLPASRVARGWCRGVIGQHSWIVVSRNPYLLGVPIIDPTLWSYDPSVTDVWVGVSKPGGRHIPHGGSGSIWSAGRPVSGGGAPIALTPSEPLSVEAKAFLGILGPLDRRGWSELANSPVLGWPAAEIIAAMDDTEELKALVPIDVLGMLTDRNPGELYF